MGDWFIVRDAHFPLVTTVYPARITWETLEPYFAAYGRVLARNAPFVSLIDMRPCTQMPDARVRRHIAEWGERVAPDRARLVLGAAFVVTHPLVRAALSAVHFIVPPRQPAVVVRDEHDGIAFVFGKLREHGLVPPDLRGAARDEGEPAR